METSCQKRSLLLMSQRNLIVSLSKILEDFTIQVKDILLKNGQQYSVILLTKLTDTKSLTKTQRHYVIYSNLFQTFSYLSLKKNPGTKTEAPGFIIWRHREDLLNRRILTTKRVTGLNGLPRVAGMTGSLPELRIGNESADPPEDW